jgi:Trp operon repressor
LHNSEGLITQKQIKQNLPVSVVQDAKVAPVVKAVDTVYNNSKGFVIHIPYQLPKLYTDMLPNSIVIQLAEASAKETRGADMLRNMTL